MERTFTALTADTEGNAPDIDVSVTPDIASDLDLNAIVARLDDLAARIEKIEQAEKTEPWHGEYMGAGAGYTAEELDGKNPPEEKETKTESEE